MSNTVSPPAWRGVVSSLNSNLSCCSWPSSDWYSTGTLLALPIPAPWPPGAALHTGVLRDRHCRIFIILEPTSWEAASEKNPTPRIINDQRPHPKRISICFSVICASCLSVVALIIYCSVLGSQKLPVQPGPGPDYNRILDRAFRLPNGDLQIVITSWC